MEGASSTFQALLLLLLLLYLYPPADSNCCHSSWFCFLGFGMMEFTPAPALRTRGSWGPLITKNAKKSFLTQKCTCVILCMCLFLPLCECVCVCDILKEYFNYIQYVHSVASHPLCQHFTCVKAFWVHKEIMFSIYWLFSKSWCLCTQGGKKEKFSLKVWSSY